MPDRLPQTAVGTPDIGNCKNREIHRLMYQSCAIGYRVQTLIPAAKSSLQIAKVHHRDRHHAGGVACPRSQYL